MTTPAARCEYHNLELGPPKPTIGRVTYEKTLNARRVSKTLASRGATTYC